MSDSDIEIDTGGASDSDSCSDEDADSVLRDACAAGDIMAVPALIEHGADVDGRESSSGATSLHLAGFHGHATIVEMLLKARARSDTTEGRGLTPLHLAAQEGHSATVHLLLESGVSASCECSLGMTPLQLAVENGRANAARALSHATDRELPLAALDDEPSVVLDSSIASEFRYQAKMMPRPLRRLIVDGAEPSRVSAAAVVHALRLPLVQFHSAAAALAPPADAVMLRVPSFLSAAECAHIRAALDAGVATNKDSVDGLPDHQLDVKSLAEMTALLGREAIQRLQQLPLQFVEDARREAAVRAGLGASHGGRDAASHGSDEPNGGAPSPAPRPLRPLRIRQVFARRYTAAGRPWFGFHRDKGPLTVNIACGPDANHEGGRLLALYDGEVRAIERLEGEATVHPSTLLHGVNRMQRGVRYSLICFYREQEPHER